MKIVFISSGNSINGIGAIVKKQGESLQHAGIDIEYFKIKGKWVQGYFHNIFIFRKFLKSNQADLVHAHYALSAYVASLAGAKPLVVSLMGSDVHSKFYYKYLNQFFNFFFWSACIVKSERMKKDAKINNSVLIPNGIDLGAFYFLPRDEARGKIGLDKLKKYVLFATDPVRIEKNISLSKTAIETLGKNVELLIVNDKTQDELNLYYNAADVVLLTSLHEGSPNVVKEAMVCNCPVVSTDVGDVSWLFGNEPGYFIAGFNPKDVADKIMLAIEFREKHMKTRGRERIIELGLDSETVAVKIIELYNRVLKHSDY